MKISEMKKESNEKKAKWKKIQMKISEMKKESNENKWNENSWNEKRFKWK